MKIMPTTTSSKWRFTGPKFPKNQPAGKIKPTQSKVAIPLEMIKRPNGMAPKTPSIAGGFWEGSGLYKPSCYYGFTFVESRGHLLGTCFQGNGDRICLYYLDNCVIGDNHFDGRKVYLPSNLTDKIEGDFDGDSCQLVDYGTKDYDVVKLHRVTKLSKTPNVFRVLGEKGP